MKNIIVLTSFLLLISIYAFEGILKQEEYICIRYTGANDKPLHTLIISKDTINADNVSKDVLGKISLKITYSPRNFIVTEDIYVKLKKLIFDYKRTNQCKKKEICNFEIFIKDAKKNRYSINEQKSIELFNLLHKKLINENNVIELDSAIIKTIKRIER